MHLAYLDDSGTHDKKSVKFQVMTGVIVEGWEFRDIELAVGMMVERLLPEERWEEVEEFHAYELFGGYGVFEGISREKRLGVVEAFLQILVAHKITIVYGAVDTIKLADKVYGSANPIDICFRLCVSGIELWAAQHIRMPATSDPDVLLQDAQPMVLVVADDFTEKPIKESIRKSFRLLRAKVRPPDYDSGKTWHLHDDLYFGNSKDSIGIQLADLCGHIVRRYVLAQPEMER